MVKKWIIGFIKHPIKIIKSFIYKPINKDLYTVRLNICSKCQDKVNVPYVGDTCGICGCILENKAKLVDEHCDLCKW